jgi:hypothetical protein
MRVELHGSLADEERAGDLTISQSLAEQFIHLPLSARQELAPVVMRENDRDTERSR